MTLNNKITKLLIASKQGLLATIKYTFFILLGLIVIALYVNIIITVGEVSYNKALQQPITTNNSL